MLSGWEGVTVCLTLCRLRPICVVCGTLMRPQWHMTLMLSAFVDTTGPWMYWRILSEVWKWNALSGTQPTVSKCWQHC